MVMGASRWVPPSSTLYRMSVRVAVELEPSLSVVSSVRSTTE